MNGRPRRNSPKKEMGEHPMDPLGSVAETLRSLPERRCGRCQSPAGERAGGRGRKRSRWLGQAAHGPPPPPLLGIRRNAGGWEADRLALIVRRFHYSDRIRKRDPLTEVVIRGDGLGALAEHRAGHGRAPEKGQVSGNDNKEA